MKPSIHPRRLSADLQDQEIERLKERLKEAHARERTARAEERERFSVLATASKRFAASMRSRMDEGQRQQRRLDAQYAVSRILEESDSLEEAAPKVFHTFGERLGWAAGVLWTVEANVLRCAGIWRSRRAPAGRFEEACREASFPRGSGLPGRVWRRGEACWVEDVLGDGAYLRRDAAAAEGLRCALAFPIQDGGKLVGVFELLGREPSPIDEDLLRVAHLIGHQIGQFVERRQAEAERDRALVREREARKQIGNILESINDAFFAVDRDWRFTYVNHRAEEFWDRSRGDMIGKCIREELPQAVGSDAHRELCRAMEERETVGFETVSPMTGLWISARAYPSADGISVSFRDITERKEADEALRASEERYRTLFETIDEGFCIIEVAFDEDGRPRDYRFLEVNPAFERHTGLQEAAGKWMRELAPGHEEYWFEIYGRVALTGEDTRFVNQAKELDGRWFDVYAFRLGDEESRRVAIIFDDITERKRTEEALRESEEWFRIAQRAARSGTWEWDLTTGEVRWSDEHRELFGFGPEEPVTREGWWAVVHPEELSRIEEAGRRCSEEGEEWPEIEYRILRDGETRWIDARGRTIRDDTGRPLRILGISVDVTARKEAEAERDRLQAREWVAGAEAAERERISRELHDRVAHSMGVAHQSLQLYGVLAEKDAARAAEKLELAKEMTKASLESTRNLSAELRELDAEEGLAEEIRHLLDVAVPPGVETKISVEGDESPVPGHVRGQLFLMLREAVRNAVAHSGCASISVGLAFDLEEVRGRVEDDGRGFDPANGHAGVGLRSMRERATLLDGALELSGRPGQGTRVEIVVPLKGKR